MFGLSSYGTTFALVLLFCLLFPLADTEGHSGPGSKDPNVIHACQTNAGGIIRYVRRNEECLPGESALHLPGPSGGVQFGRGWVWVVDSSGRYLGVPMNDPVANTRSGFVVPMMFHGIWFGLQVDAQGFFTPSSSDPTDPKAVLLLYKGPSCRGQAFMFVDWDNDRSLLRHDAVPFGDQLLYGADPREIPFCDGGDTCGGGIDSMARVLLPIGLGTDFQRLCEAGTFRGQLLLGIPTTVDLRGLTPPFRLIYRE